MAQNLEQRKEVIWHQEHVLAFELAKTMIQKPTISFWMMLLPFLFLFFIMNVKKYKSAIHQFANDFLRNKKTALELAFNAVLEDASIEKALADFAADNPPPSPDQTSLYEAQRREITLLASHYKRLLTARGDTYEKLVKNVYSTMDFQRFLDALSERENEVLQNALRVNTPEGDLSGLIKEMQAALRRIRQAERDRIFKAG